MQGMTINQKHALKGLVLSIERAFKIDFECDGNKRTKCYKCSAVRVCRRLTKVQDIAIEVLHEQDVPILDIIIDEAARLNEEGDSQGDLDDEYGEL